jgi:hypothetical protein
MVYYKIIYVKEDLFWFIKKLMAENECSDPDKFLRKKLLGDKNGKIHS